MKCPSCGGQMGLEDVRCPYCGTPNAMAVKHQTDMAEFRREYQRTQADVMRKTSFMQRHGSWLAILVVLLVALIAGIILHALAWDIGYSIREKDIERNMVEDAQVMDEFLAQGDYGKFCGYYDANDISLASDNSYQGLQSAARAYVDLMRYISDIHDSSDFSFKPEYISNTCGYLAEDLNRIYALEEHFPYDTDRYLPSDKLVYVDDIRDRTTAIAKTYFGLTDAQIREIPDMSKKKLAALIEKGLSS